MGISEENVGDCELMVTGGDKSFLIVFTVLTGPRIRLPVGVRSWGCPVGWGQEFLVALGGLGFQNSIKEVGGQEIRWQC